MFFNFQKGWRKYVFRAQDHFRVSSRPLPHWLTSKGTGSSWAAVATGGGTCREFNEQVVQMLPPELRLMHRMCYPHILRLPHIFYKPINWSLPDKLRQVEEKRLSVKKFKAPKKSNFFPREHFSSKIFLVHMEAKVLQEWQTTLKVNCYNSQE